MVERPDFEAYRLVSPVEPTQIAAQLRERKFDVGIFDLGVYKTGGDDALDEKVRETKPDAIVVVQSILTFATAQDFDGGPLFERLRRIHPGVVTALTGCHATNYPGKAVGDGNCDYSIKGECDFALPELFEKVNQGASLEDIPGLSFKKKEDGQVFNSDRYPTVDVNALATPAYDLFSREQLEAYYRLPEFAKIRYPEKSLKYRDIMTSRSCVLRCTFCSVSHLRGEQPYRRKKEEKVLAEIEQALDQGVEEIHFFDDLFVRSEKQIIEFCNALVKRNLKFHWFVAQGQPLWPLTYDALAAMKETGLYRVICPFESGNNRVLKKVVGKPTTIEKNHEVIQWLKQLELEIIGMFVVGLPGETAEEILDTINFAEQHPEIDYSVFSIATPMVGTKLMQQVTSQGLLSDQNSINKVIKRTVALYRTEEFSQVSMGIIRAYEWDRINFASPARQEKYARMVGITQKQLEIVRSYSIDTFKYFFPDYDGPRSYRDLLSQVRVKANELQPHIV